MMVDQVMRPILLEKKKWKPEIKDSWMTFFSSIVKVFFLVDAISCKTGPHFCIFTNF